MYVSVRVVAGAKEERVEELAKGRLKIFVREPAERNRANARVVELLSARFGAPARLISGHHSPSKLFSIEGVE